MHEIDCHYLNSVDTYPAMIGRVDEKGHVTGCKKIVCTKQQVEQYALEFLCETPTEEYADTIGMKWWGPAKESDTPVEDSGIAIEPGFISMANLVSAKNAQIAGIQQSILCGRAESEGTESNPRKCFGITDISRIRKRVET